MRATKRENILSAFLAEEAAAASATRERACPQRPAKVLIANVFQRRGAGLPLAMSAFKAARGRVAVSDFLPVVAGLTMPSILDLVGKPGEDAQPNGAFAGLLESGEQAPLTAAHQPDPSVSLLPLGNLPQAKPSISAWSRATPTDARQQADQRPIPLAAAIDLDAELGRLASEVGTPLQTAINGAATETVLNIAIASEIPAPGTLSESRAQPMQTEQGAAVDHGVTPDDVTDASAVAPEIMNFTASQAQAALLLPNTGSATTALIENSADPSVGAVLQSGLKAIAGGMHPVGAPEPALRDAVNQTKPAHDVVLSSDRLNLRPNVE